ncbi:MAG TPA: HIT family protein [Polyangia bacterium]|nr:HIT family protein [Polyangia bacterium]
MKPCALCELGAGREAGRIVYRDQHAFAFFPLHQDVRGHTVVAPLVHVATWSELGAEVVSGLFLAAQRVSERLCSRLSAAAVNVLFAGGPTAQQSVPHFHVHVLPRWPGDGVDAWPKLPGYHGDREGDFRAVTGSEG